MKARCVVEVNNVPKDAKGYIVARRFDLDGELWYWGTFETLERAREVARDKKINGVVVMSAEELK